jgi:hypothetical protein
MHPWNRNSVIEIIISSMFPIIRSSEDSEAMNEERQTVTSMQETRV